MSPYDDMCVLPNSTLVARVCSTNTSTSTHKNKAYLWKTIDSTRFWLLLLLVASPVSASPVRNRRSSSSSSSTSSSSSSSSSDNRLSSDGTAETTPLEREISQQLQLAVERSSLRVLRSVQEQQLSLSSKSRTSSNNNSTTTATTTTTTTTTTTSSSRNSRHSSSSGSSSRMEDQPDNVNNSRNRREAHWSQPCSNLMQDSSNNQKTLSGYILSAVARAHSYVVGFREEYALETLQVDWQTAVENFTKDQHIHFLKEITTPTNVDFNAQLQDAYEMMQRLAVGIEQVTLDQALYRGTFLEEFRTIENNIVAILCQLHYAMVHQNLAPSVVVTKEIMGEEYRDLEGQMARKMRDTIIVREYNTALIHMKDVFMTFK